MLNDCLTCTTQFAVGLKSCPHCGDNNFVPQGVLMPKITRHGGPSNVYDDDEIVQVLYRGRTYAVRRGDLKDAKSEDDKEFFEELRRNSGKFDGAQDDEEATEDTDPTEDEGHGDSEPEDGSEHDSEGDPWDHSEPAEEEGDDVSPGKTSSTSTTKQLKTTNDTAKRSQQPAPTTGGRLKKIKKA